VSTGAKTAFAELPVVVLPVLLIALTLQPTIAFEPEAITTPEEQTAASILEKMTGIPVVNLGILGGNVFNIKHNLSVLLESYTPKAIIIAWPLPTRWADPDGYNWGMWFFADQLDTITGLRSKLTTGTIKPDLVRFNEYKELLFSGKLETMSYECIDSIREMIKQYTLVEFIYTSPKLESTYISTELGTSVKTYMIHYVDHTPDNLHPGPKTNIIAAEWLEEQLRVKSI
jgi:hypothetical protein